MNKLFEIFVIALAITGLLSCFGVEHCRECDESGKNCKKCESPFYPSGSGCDPIENGKMISNCISHIFENSLIKCQECEMGFYLFDQLGTQSCINCADSGCPFCGNNRECLACYNNDVERGSGTPKIVCKNEICIQNCEICHNSKSELKCYKCKDGFAINKDQSECIPNIQDCQVVERNDQNLICKVCNSGYAIQENGRCEESVTKNQDGIITQYRREKKLRNKKDLL